LFVAVVISGHIRWKGKVDQNINLALGSKDGNVECGAATQWEGPVWRKSVCEQLFGGFKPGVTKVNR
jgi:hypothetical protein